MTHILQRMYHLEVLSKGSNETGTMRKKIALEKMHLHLGHGKGILLLILKMFFQATGLA